MAEEELVEITLNHEGELFNVVVDFTTANALLNDADAADAYFKEYIAPYREPNNHTHQEETEALAEPPSPPTNIEKYVLWSGRRPNNIDHKGTELLLQYRKKLSSKFDDRKTSKNKLWLDISKKKTEHGLNLGDNLVDKVRQKFYNLQKLYFQYIKNIKTTGADRKEQPLFYQEIHAILGEKDKSVPKILTDSEELKNTKEASNSEVNSPEDIKQPSTSSSASAITDRFKRPKGKLAPPSQSEKFMKFIQDEIATDRSERKAEMEKLHDNLEVQNAQRERFLNLFEELVKKKKGKKRQLPESDSD